MAVQGNEPANQTASLAEIARLQKVYSFLVERLSRVPKKIHEEKSRGAVVQPLSVQRIAPGLPSVEKLMETISDRMLDFGIRHEYLILDLEATRRENDYLRKMLEEVNGDGEAANEE